VRRSNGLWPRAFWAKPCKPSGRESGTAKLEEAVAAHRDALKEMTRERAPLQWAMSFGNQGVVLVLLAQRRRDAAMAETALSQINEAFETMRDGGDARQAAYFEARLGENDIPPERLAAKLVEIAERFKDLQAAASAQPGDDPKIAALKTDAQKAIEAGELTKADALLADAETEQRRALDRSAVDAAETSAQRGEIALTRLRYAEAAKHFANAAGAFPAIVSRAVFGSIHRTCQSALVTDRAMKAWYHPSIAWMAPNRRVTWQATSDDENS
jgi:tetratricopeptide (TPR) repeat protein